MYQELTVYENAQTYLPVNLSPRSSMCDEQVSHTTTRAAGLLAPPKYTFPAQECTIASNEINIMPSCNIYCKRRALHFHALLSKVSYHPYRVNKTRLTHL